jgi:hypothetical protein
VDVFDIDSYIRDPASNGSWYAQATTGDIPDPRTDFCTVVMSAPDNSSHHIYLYGGRNPLKNIGYDDMLILSLPSFTWTNVWPLGESPRWGHNCHVAGKRQMLTVGGDTTNKKTCDWETKGIAVWEMSSLTWGSVFSTSLPDYQVPQILLPVTGGNVNGGAMKKDPAGGWTDQGLKTVFATPRRVSAPPSNIEHNNGTAPAPALAPPKSNHHTGATAGGVVGGVAALVFLTTLIFLLHRRHSKSRGPHELHNDSSAQHRELSNEKTRFELPAMNEDQPAELPGPDLRELDSPRQAYEAGGEAVVRAAELSGTTVAPGGSAGVPMIRTPGDDLPVLPRYVAGLRKLGSNSMREMEEGRGMGKDEVEMGAKVGVEVRHELATTTPELSTNLDLEEEEKEERDFKEEKV